MHGSEVYEPQSIEMVPQVCTARFPDRAGPKRRSWLVGLIMATLAAAASVGPGIRGYAQDSSPRTNACTTGRGGVPAERLAVLARGFSLPGWTDQYQPRPPSESMLAHLRAMKLTHVRLPVTLELISDSFGGPTVAERALVQIETALATLMRLGYAVSLDMHPGTRFQDLHKQDPARALKLLKAAWQRLAGRFARVPADRVFFEVLNEPVVSAEVWAEQGPQVVAVIRNAAPNHTIIYGPTLFQRTEALEALTPLEDRNVVYAVHFYDPMNFTHQGQTWGASPPANLPPIPFPSRPDDVALQVERLRAMGRAGDADEMANEFEVPWTAQRIDDIFSSVAAWSVRHDRPVIVNEFGVLTFKAAPEARAAWIAAVRNAAERHCLGWTHWEYADGFGFVRRSEGQETLDPIIGLVLSRSP